MFKMLNIELASEFIVMAATLMYIKSRTLLPRHHQPPEEDAEEDDPRWDLIRQLIEYKKFKDAAEFLGKREVEQQDMFAAHPEKPELPKDEPESMPEIGIFDLIRAFQKVLSRFEDSRELGEIVDDRFTVSDKIDYLLTHIEPGRSLRFIELFERATSRTEVIVTFLALLELIKLRQFRVEQSEALGEISITRSENAGRLDEDDYAGIDEA
ncbi:MAG: segregation/condensation protein A [Verrucomicrobiales bacterium]